MNRVQKQIRSCLIRQSNNNKRRKSVTNSVLKKFTSDHSKANCNGKEV